MPLVGRADLARLLCERPEGAQASAGLLGFRAPALAPKARPAIKGPTAAARVPVKEVAPDPPSLMPLWRLSAVTFTSPLAASTPTAGSGLTSADHAASQRSLCAGPTEAPLVPWSRLEPRLFDLLAERIPGHAIDVSAAVKTLGRGQPLAQLPRRQRAIWPRRLTVWIDLSAPLMAIWRDQRAVVAHLVAACGEAHVRRQWLTRPDRGTSDGAQTVLALTDLGHGAASWQRAGAALLRHGARPVALVPQAHTRAGRWQALPWAPTPGALPPAVGADRLLCLAAPASFVQPGLLRALRRLDPRLNLEAELEAWRHADVRSAAPSGLVLTPEAAIERRRRFFAEVPEAMQRRVAAVLNRWRAYHPPLLAHVETRAWLALAAHPPGDVDEARAMLARLAASVGADADPTVRHVARNVLDAMPDEAYEDPTDGRLLQRLHVQAYAGLEGARVPGNLDIEALREALPPPPEARLWAARQVGAELVLDADPRSGAAAPLAVLPAARPLVWCQGAQRTRHGLGGRLPLPDRDSMELETDSAHLTLERWVPEPWAVAAGRDRFGLWADLDLKGVPQRMRWIPPGRFVMGSPATEAGRFTDEGPQHEVVIERGFWLGDTPVTQALWQAVMQANPSRFKGMERPVEQVSWDDTQTFMGQAGLAGLALPTEAQWEYACRAGTTTATWRGDDEAARADIAWYGANSEETQPVKRKPANPWGVYDMLGNVWEWCADAWRTSYEGAAPGPGSSGAASRRVIRGCFWGSPDWTVRAARRDRDSPGGRYDSLGFRLALQPAAEPGSPAGGGGVGPGRAPGGAGSRGPEARGRS